MNARAWSRCASAARIWSSGRQRDFMVGGDAAIESAGWLTFGSAVWDHRPGCGAGEGLVAREG